jgi:hypothetical protein
MISIAIPSLAMTTVRNNEVLLNLNTPPYPPIIEGPSSGRIRQSYEYSFTLTDPDIDDFLTTLEINFGEDENEVLAFHCADLPWYNGTIIKVGHTWRTGGDYEIKARSSDSFGEWSEWSDPFVVSMPKTKSPQFNFIYELFEKLLLYIF